jgi:ATP-binding cassette subfamily B protein
MLQYSKSPLRFIWHFVKPYKVTLSGISVLVIFAAVFRLLIPYASKLLFNNLTSGGNITTNLGSILFYVALIPLLSLLNEACWQGVARPIIKVESLFQNTIIKELFDYVEAHSYNYFSNSQAGAIGSRISDMADSTVVVVENFIYNFFGYSTVIIGSIVLLWFSNPLFAYVFFIWLLLYFFVSVAVSKKREVLSAKSADAWSALAGELVDTLSNFNTLIMFGTRRKADQYLRPYFKETAETFRKNYYFGRNITAFHAVSSALLTVTTLGIAAYLFVQGKVGYGDFVLIFSAVQMVEDFMRSLGGDIIDFYKNFGEIKNGIATLLVPHEITDAPDATTLKVKTPSITFDNISFSYVPDKPVFKNMSFVIEPNQSVALVGVSGSGKSTLINLLMRFYDLQDGRILIDHQDIAKVTQESLRSHIATIPQDTTLFHRSIIENIRYGKPEASDKEVIEAAKKAYAHDFIMNLENGYKTIVGERGLKLSGGQRQRIAIARAILKNAPILILDEATSSLDSLSEEAIQHALKKVMEHKTTIAIAHRLSTVLHVDRIIVLSEGKIVGDGDHQTLLKQGGIYAKMWQMQIGGYLGKI